MEDSKRYDVPKKPTRASAELGTVTITSNPGPDAQDRLRRLFSLLVKYASKDKLPPTESDPPSEDANEVED